jgi:hypothetical protein
MEVIVRKYFALRGTFVPGRARYIRSVDDLGTASQFVADGLMRARVPVVQRTVHRILDMNWGRPAFHNAIAKHATDGRRQRSPEEAQTGKLQ